MSYVLGTYARSVKENFVSGKGIYLYTDKGEEFIDFVQGISVNAFGHNHEYLVKTIKEQSEKHRPELEFPVMDGSSDFDQFWCFYRFG